MIAESYVNGTISTLEAYRPINAFVSKAIPVLRRKYHSNSEPSHAQADADSVLAGLNYYLGQGEADRLTVITFTAEAARLWRHYRVIYQLHEGLFDALDNTTVPGRIPCDMFTQLPHVNPFIAFPVNFPALVGDDKSAISELPVYIGMYVTGLTRDQTVCSTDHDRLDRLYVALATRIRYTGQDVTYEETTFMVPASGLHSVDDMISATRRHVRVGTTSEAELRRLYELALNVLMYVVSDQRDSRTLEPEAQTIPKKRRKGKRKTSKIVNLGYRFGPALQAARRDSDSATPRQTSGRKLRKPHLRRGHWRLYYTGTRSDPVPRHTWIKPHIVGKALSGDTPTIVDVRLPANDK